MPEKKRMSFQEIADVAASLLESNAETTYDEICAVVGVTRLLVNYGGSPGTLSAREVADLGARFIERIEAAAPRSFYDRDAIIEVAKELLRARAPRW